MSNNQKISFWNLIKEQKIVIPIIQRDYAQGRKDKQYLRQKFLSDLKLALDGKGNLTLDFVYGTQKSDSLEPLDGQQRLTTLWLLHWYIAYRTQTLRNEEQNKWVRDILKNFTYETRVSSREFCEKLCDLELNQNQDVSLLDYIQQKTWFFSSWKQDPTIQAMLRMLCGEPNTDSESRKEIIDGIDKLFNKISEQNLNVYWERLTKDNSIDCPITFYEMAIGNSEMPLSDDLYIKMNARGKPLTSFENFKADLIGWIDQQMKKGKLVKYASLDYASWIDNDWTDVFWTKGDGQNVGRVDEIFLSFINRYFYNLVVCADKKKIDNSEFDSNEDEYKDFNDKIKELGVEKWSAYESFEPYAKYFNVGVLERLERIFNNLKELDNSDFICPWKKDFCFIPRYENDNQEKDNHGNDVFPITTITWQGRVVFYAICKYLEQEDSQEDEQDSLKHWVRFVWNLVLGVDGIDRMKEAMGYIDRIGNCHQVYKSLCSINLVVSKETYLSGQFREEIEKAKQIVAKQDNPAIVGPNEFKIIRAEKFKFFYGSIRFLFTNGDKQIDWSDFDVKWKNIKRDIKCGHTIKRMISYLQDADIKEIFKYGNNNFSNIDENLRNILLKYSSKVHNFLVRKKIHKDGLTILQKDLVTLCENEDCVNRYISTKYNYDLPIELLVLTYYKGDCKTCVSDSYVIGDSRFRRYEQEILQDSLFNNQIEIENPKAEHKQGVDIKFTYFKEGKEYKFRWQRWNWVDMYEGDDNLWDKGEQLVKENQDKLGCRYKHLHSYYPNADDLEEYRNGNSEELCYFDSAEMLMNELDRCVAEYESIKAQEAISKN